MPHDTPLLGWAAHPLPPVCFVEILQQKGSQMMLVPFLRPVGWMQAATLIHNAVGSLYSVA
jgi:hypothetical protein